ncbi:MAG: aconitate hydratase, partial [Clostridiales bacterium]|nr:aconitate hydratase [Clostridiales bacterium]
CPHSPDAVKPVRELSDIKVDQVCIGSCTNSSLADMLKVAAILKGKTIAPNVSLTVSPGSRQVLTMLSACGALADIIGAGARVLECACGPCIGMGQSPKTNAVSVRTFNRNFYARSGTASANVYLVSPETAAFTALNGKLTDPADYPAIEVRLPETFAVNDNLILRPEDFTDVEVVRGPNIKPFPKTKKLEKNITGKTLIVCEDNITTDHIMPSNSKLLPYRSNIPYLADFCLNPVDPEFSRRAKENGGGFIVAGQNYGQGSSREHAALVPLYLGIRAVLAVSFARIHQSNLINNGILPLVFVNPDDKNKIKQGDELCIADAPAEIQKGDTVTVVNKTTGDVIATTLVLSERLKKVMLAGGVLAEIAARK